MLASAADLVSPVAAVREFPWLTREMLRIALGRSGLRFEEKDARFADVTWRDNPVFRRLGQSYRLYEVRTDRMVEAADGPWERRARTRYLANIITGAVSPTNFLPDQPAGAQARL